MLFVLVNDTRQVCFLISNSCTLCQCVPYSSNIPFGITEREWRSTLVQVIHTVDPYLPFVEHDENLLSPCQMPDGGIGMRHDAVLTVMINIPVISCRQIIYPVLNRLLVQRGRYALEIQLAPLVAI